MIGRKTLLVFLNTVAGGLLGLVAIKTLGYYVDEPAVIGSVAYAIGLLGLVYFVSDLGFGQAHVKRVSEGMDEADCFATFFVFKVAVTLLLVLIGLGIYVYKSFINPSSFTDLETVVLFFILGYYVLLSFRILFVSTFDAHLEAARVQIVILVDTVVRISLTVLVALLYAALIRDLGPLEGFADAFGPLAAFVLEHPAGALALTYTLGLAVSLVVAIHQWRKRGVGMGRFRWEILKGYATYALPLFLLLVVDTVSAQIDRVMLGFFGTDRELGIFDLPRRFTQLIEVIPWTVAGFLFPQISALDAAGEHDKIRRDMGRSLRYISLIVLPIVTFIALFPEHLIRIFIGNAWLPGATAFSLLVIYAFAIGMARPYFSLIAGMGRSDLTAKAGIVMATSNIALNAVLIPDSILGVPLAGLKITGAALATLLSSIIGFIMIRYTANRLVGKVPVPGFYRHLAAAAIMGGALLLMDSTDVLALVRWYQIPIYAAVGATVYFAVLALLRELTRDDVTFFMDVINVKELAGYVRDELGPGRGTQTDERPDK